MGWALLCAYRRLADETTVGKKQFNVCSSVLRKAFYRIRRSYRPVWHLQNVFLNAYVLGTITILIGALTSAPSAPALR